MSRSARFAAFLPATSLACILLLSSLFAMPARAGSLRINALSCQPMDGAAQNDLDYREVGLGNKSTSSARTVFCPFDRRELTSFNISNVDVTYLDVNGVAPCNVSCYLWWTSTSGYAGWGRETRYSCIQSVGCASDSEPGFWLYSTQMLRFTSPFTSNMGAANVAAVGIACSIPPKTSGGAISRLIGIQVDYN